jgi:hypothetical protein
MPIALTCDCGARFDLDESLAGQKVNCPECSQPLEVRPGGAVSPPRTSLLALASIVLALFGAFTVVGTTAAIVVGIAALAQIQRRRDRLTGAGLALTGILAGLAFTALTVALLASDLVGVDGWVRARTMAGQVDTSGALEVLTRDGNVLIRRPSTEWGRVLGDRSGDPAVGELQKKRELLLAHVRKHAFLDIAVAGNVPDLRAYEQTLRSDLAAAQKPLLGDDTDEPVEIGVVTRDGKPEDLDPIDGWDVRQWIFNVQLGSGPTWRFWVRACRKASADDRGAEPVYVLRGYAPKWRFASVEEDLKSAMDSVRLPK